MRTQSRTVALGLALAMSIGAASPAAAQGIGGWIKQKAKEKATQRAEDRAERAIDKAVEEAEGAIVCAVTDTECIQNAEKSGQQVTLTDQQGNVVGHSAAEAARPGQGAWANYDFVPGDRVLFVDDFSADRVGDFPRRLEFRGGSMQVVEWQGGRWLSDAGSGEFYVNLPEVLPERFTIEFGLAGSGNAMEIEFDPGKGRVLYIGSAFASARSGDIRPEGQFKVNTEERPVRIRISVDGDYLKFYADEHRVLNAPNLAMGRSRRIRFFLNGWSAEEPRMISDLRIMAGGRELYDALNTSGRVATQGIYFDTGSDRLRPESTPTLKEIGAMLKANPGLRLLIEGHTDNVGNAASNQVLSEKRAAAVKAFLEKEYGIDAGRLEARGFGDTKPVAPNDTPEGRQANRRVELVKL